MPYIDKLRSHSTPHRPLLSFSSSLRPPGSWYHWQLCWLPSRKVPGALQSWFLTYKHRLQLQMSAMPRTTLFKTESSRRQMLEIPASFQEHAGKTRKWSRAVENNFSDWPRRQERQLGEIWGGKYRLMIGCFASDTCWLLSWHLERYICSLYSILMFSLLTNFGMFTSSVEARDRMYITHHCLPLESAKQTRAQ